MEGEARLLMGSFEANNWKVDLWTPDLWYYVQFGLFFGFAAIFGTVMSWVVYHGIILPKDQASGKQKSSSSSSSSVTPYLVGFGLVLPLFLTVPFWLANLFDIRSTPLRLMAVALPMTGGLRTLQAMASGTPRKSWNDFRYDFAFVLHPKRDPQTLQPIPATAQSVFRTFSQFVTLALVLSAAGSYLIPHGFTPYERPRPATEIFVSLDWAHLANNFVQAVITSWQLEFSLDYGVNLIMQIISGVQFENVVDSPMFGSQSPSEFWGRRWNDLIHTDLKGSVFRPVRHWTGSKHMAALAAFAASGLMHEYIWFYLFHRSKHQQNNDDSYHAAMQGKQMLFFGWNGILLVFEYTVGKKAWQRFARSMFPACTTMIVIMMALPVGHLFTGDFVEGKFYEDVCKLVPLVRATAT